jgi:hypothetical protein
MTPGAALLVALLSQAAGGSPQDSAVPRLRLAVRAPAECTSRADLASRITARSPRIGIADDAAVAAQVVITVQRPGSVVADIRVGPAGLDQAPRRVLAHSCAEAADSAALIIAVTLDPSLMRESSSGRAGEQRRSDEAAAPNRARPKTTPASTPISAKKPGGATASPQPPTPPPPPVVATPAPEAAPPPEPEQAPRPPPPPSRRQFGATLNGQTVFGAAPGVLPGVALYLMAALDRESLWTPALFLGATHAWRSDFAETGGTASFTLDAISLDACPLALRWGLLAARPCASALVGRLASEGSSTNQGAARPYGVAGAALAASFGARWQLSARLGLGATLLRDQYEFATNVFYRAAPVTFSASLGAGVFWH